MLGILYMARTSDLSDRVKDMGCLGSQALLIGREGNLDHGIEPIAMFLRFFRPAAQYSRRENC